MMKKNISMLCLFFLLLTGTSAPAASKAIIGETAWIDVGGIPFSYLARIDTGARTTSIHAVNIKIIDGSTVAEENVGKTISFQTLNREGKILTVKERITKVSTVTNSQGTEKRYVVELPISWKDVHKTVTVNLRDRSKMQYKLLIGRNWLSKDFLVDVDLKAVEKGEKE